MDPGPQRLQEVEARLAAALERTRRDTLVFTGCVVLFAPVVLVIAVLVVILSAQWVGFPLGALAVRHSGAFRWFPTLALSLLLARPFLRCLLGRIREPHARRRCQVALLLHVALVAATFGTSWAIAAPAAFWWGYAFTLLVVLALVGSSYQPRTEYRLGWLAGGGRLYDDPFSLRDDLDRHHVALGFAVALPTAVLAAYTEVFASSWIWRGLTRPEIGLAARVLSTLVRGRGAGARILLSRAGPETGVRVRRALIRLRLVQEREGALQLTVDGAELLGLDPLLVAPRSA